MKIMKKVMLVVKFGKKSQIINIKLEKNKKMCYNINVAHLFYFHNFGKILKKRRKNMKRMDEDLREVLKKGKTLFFFAGFMAIMFLGLILCSVKLEKNIEKLGIEKISKVALYIKKVKNVKVSEKKEPETEEIQGAEQPRITIREEEIVQLSDQKEILGTEVPVEIVSEIAGFPQFNNEADIYLLAQMIYCEVGGCTPMDMYATGCVILNRARTDFANFKEVSTIKEVLYDPWQYATPTIQKIESGFEPSDVAIKVAEMLIKGEVPCLNEAILFQADGVPSFMAEEIKIPGTSGDVVYSIIKNEYFNEYKNMQ